MNNLLPYAIELEIEVSTREKKHTCFQNGTQLILLLVIRCYFFEILQKSLVHNLTLISYTTRNFVIIIRYRFKSVCKLGFIYEILSIFSYVTFN